MKKLEFIHSFWAYAGGVSIRTKIFGIVLGTTLLLSFAFAWQTRSVQVKELEHKTQDQGISIARDVAARATDLILINDLYALHQLLTETQTNYHDIRYIFITNPDGEVLAHTFGSGMPADLITANQVGRGTFQHTQVLETDEGTVWDVAVPVFDGKAGTARVGISDTNLRKTIGTMTAQLSLTIVVVLAISLLAATFLTWLLTRPILSLVAATEAVAKGDFSQRVPRWANDEIGHLAVAFNQMTIELARVESLHQEQELLRRQLLEGVITAQEEERRRIARELHDSTSQSLTSLIVGLRMLEADCGRPEVSIHTAKLRDVVSKTLEEVNTLALQLRPPVLDDLGLEAALTRYIDEWQNRYAVFSDLAVHIGDERLDGSTETALYRIIQEALTNTARHAKAETVSVLVERRENSVITVIEDDGLGFDSISAPEDGHLGLLGIRERAELLGGKLTIESAIGQGTSVFVEIPDSVKTSERIISAHG